MDVAVGRTSAALALATVRGVSESSGCPVDVLTLTDGRRGRLGRKADPALRHVVAQRARMDKPSLTPLDAGMC